MKTQNQEGLRLKNLLIENFKNIDKFSFDFNGGSYFITGKNGAGKSAILQAITSPLDSVFRPTQAIKQGETHGSIEMEIEGIVDGLPKGYKIALYFNPAKKEGRLVVKNQDGEDVKSPSSALKSILGSIAIDPLEFSRLPTASTDAKKKTKISVLKQLTGLDFTELDMKKYKLTQDKTILNASIKAKENDLTTHTMSQEDLMKYEKPIDEAPIKEEFNALGEKIAAWSDANSRVAKHQENIAALESAVSTKQENIIHWNEQIEELKAKTLQALDAINKDRGEIAAAEEKLALGKAWQAKNPSAPSSQDISRRMEEAREHNDKHKRVLELITKHGAIATDKAAKEKLDTQLKEIEAEKKDLLSKAKLPVAGLEFDSEAVTINGIPFEENDLNTAQQIEYGIQIAMAANPDLKLIMIQDGSLLDNETTANIFKACTEKGYQLLIERVRPEGGETELKFIEEELK
jgi:DNA repair exonuclease SbcCD ATPase subunit